MVAHRARASISLFLIALVGMSASAQSRSEARAEREIRAVLVRQAEAWNRRDLEGFMAGYWRSPDLTFYSGGTATSGWEQTLERYRNSYQREGREMGTLTFSGLRIETAGAGHAFVRGRWHLEMTTGESGGLFTLVFRELKDGWKIIHDHTGSSPG